jgi:type IV pilus assembly protein PilM
MAASQIIALDLGAYSLKVALFRPSGQGGLIIDGFSTFTIGSELASDEDKWAATSQGIRQIISKYSVRQPAVIFGVSGQWAVSRFVKLPPSDPAQVPQMVFFEAKQNIPFPMEEVVWDYQLIQPSGAQELEAIIVAIKSKDLNGFNGAVQQAGLLASKVDVAPAALYNAVRFNYPDNAGCTLVLDIGAKSTQMIFVEPGRIFIRGVPVAGNQITQAIAREMNVDLTEADQIKHERGFVGLGGQYEDPPDATAARASKIIRSTLTRLHSEINRSIAAYKTQQGGSPPQRILLSGGTSLLPYMDLFLSEKLKSEVSFFNPLRNIAVGPSVDRAGLVRNAHLLGECVGMALREVGPTSIEVNLVPPSVRAQLRSKTHRNTLAALVAAWLVLIAVLNFGAFRQNSLVSQELEARKADLAKLQADQSQLKGEQNKLKTSFAEGDQILKLGGDRVLWQQILGDINKGIPTGIWIRDMQPAANGVPIGLVAAPVAPANPSKGGRPAKSPAAAAPAAQVTQLIFSGMYEAYDQEALSNAAQAVSGEQAVKAFLTKLTQSPYFDMSEADIQNPALVQIDVRSGQGNLALNFKISAKLKQPISLLLP